MGGFTALENIIKASMQQVFGLEAELQAHMKVMGIM